MFIEHNTFLKFSVLVFDILSINFHYDQIVYIKSITAYGGWTRLWGTSFGWLGNTQNEHSTILVNNYWIIIIKSKEKFTQLTKTLHFADPYLCQTILGPLRHFLSMAQNGIRPNYWHKNNYSHVLLRQKPGLIKICKLQIILNSVKS